MKLDLTHMRERLALIGEVLAIGRTFGDGRMTTAQAADAINRVGRRNQPQQVVDHSALVEAAAGRRDDDLVGAR